MKITFISDTHSKEKELTADIYAANSDYEYDSILIHAGDVTNGGTRYEITKFLEWFSEMPYTHKVFIAGNHDWGFEGQTDIAEEFKEKGITYLFDSEVTIEGIRIYGSPWQPRFYDWAFNVNRGADIAKKWEKIPEGLDILITHGPAHGILDYTYTGMHVGCEDLFNKIMEVKPRVHVSGHIHYARNIKEFNGITFINACCLGENYRYQNKPITLILDKDKNITDFIIE